MKTVDKTLRAVFGAGYLASTMGKELEDGEPILEATMDQALKELETLLLESLPKDRKLTGSSINNVKQFVALGYNDALEDTRKAIKELMK